MSKPCFRCGGTERYASGNCVVCTKARAKRVRIENPDKHNADNRAYHARTPEKQRVRSKRYAVQNRESQYARRREWVAANPERVLAYGREWREGNRQKSRTSASTWQARNRDVATANQNKRRAVHLRCTPTWANEFFLKEAYNIARIRTRVTGIKWHVDHIVPLQSKTVCGLHVENNLQVIPAIINMAKGNRYWPDQP